jgi:hypothetical protein
MAAFVARGSESTAGKAERSGEKSMGSPPDYDKTIRQRGGGDQYNKLLVVVNLCSK